MQLQSSAPALSKLVQENPISQECCYCFSYGCLSPWPRNI